MKKTSLLALAALCCSASAIAADAVWGTAVAGSDQTYCIKTDGTLWAWGSAQYGELGNGSKDPQKVSTPTLIGEDTNWKSVAAGSGRAYFLKTDGTIWSVGSAEGGALGTNSAAAQTTPVQIGTDTDWASVATSTHGMNFCALAIKTDGTLWGWGKGDNGQLGVGNYNTYAVPVKVGTDNDWKSVSLGQSHSLGLKTDGTIWGCGDANYGNLGAANIGYNKNWVKVADAADWTNVYAIDNATYLLKADGTLWACGENRYDILAGKVLSEEGESNDDMKVFDLVQVNLPGKVLDLSGSQYFRVALVQVDGKNKVYAWGQDYCGAIGNGTGVDRNDYAGMTVYVTPQEVVFEEPVEVTSVSCGQLFTVVSTTVGKLYGWGSNLWGQLGTSEPENMLGVLHTTPIEVAATVAEADDTAEFDAANIPATLAGVEKIKLIGTWGTADLANLIPAIGNTQGFMGFNYNTSLKSVDMSEVTFAENTSLEKVFRNCSALESVTFPTNESAANIVSLNNAFLSDKVLAYVNVENLVNVTDIAQAFQNCKALTSIDLSKWNGVTNSEMAFQNSDQIAYIALPGDFAIGDRCFGACDGLKLIDWSTFTGDAAPAIVVTDKYEPFYNLDFLPETKAAITIIVPARVYNSFAENAYWKGFTLEAAAEPGTYTVDADEIPASLADAIHLVLTGSWDTAKFASLAKALGTATNGTASNSTLVSLDMSAIEVAASTKLKMTVPGALWGSVDKGIFQNYKSLETVVMPAADQAANFTSFLQAFQDCAALKSIDLSGCTGITETNDAFYNCSSLTSVVFPASIPLNREMFDRCNALANIDWSAFAGTTAPTYSSNAIPTLGKALTVKVPATAYDSFVESTYWKNFNIVKVGDVSGVDSVISNGNAPVEVYDLNGRHVTTLAPDASAANLPAGIYVIGSKKVIVR